MKIIVSEKTREKINIEYARFIKDPNNLARLKMKLTLNQRIFLESLQEAYDNSNNIQEEDRQLLLQEAILTFNAEPELVPNVPIDLMKKKVTFKESVDDFEQLLILIKVWKNSIRRSKRPINRLAIFFARWSKIILYPFFVATLTAAFTSILTTTSTVFAFNYLDTKYIGIAIVSAFVSLAAGKGIYLRIVSENLV